MDTPTVDSRSLEIRTFDQKEAEAAISDTLYQHQQRTTPTSVDA